MTARLHIPELDERDLRLELDQASLTVKGTSEQVPPEASLAGRVRLGGPLVVPITAGDMAGDPELLVIIRAEADSFRYFTIHLACTFEPGQDEEFERAWVAVDLESGNAGEAPIAWSMTPDKLSHPVKLKGSLEVGADAKFASAKASAGQERDKDDVYLEALNQLRSDPVWEFSTTPSERLYGNQRLALIVRQPAAVTGRGRIRLRALIRKRRYKAFPYDVPLSDSNAPIFEIT